MKNISKLFEAILILVVIFSMSSCSTAFLANPGIDPIVFTKPAYRDSAFVSSYIGGKFNKSTYFNSYSDINNNNFGQLYFYQSQTEKYFNFSYGTFGYYGQIDIETDGINQKSKSYYGGGVSSEMNWNVPTRFVNIRPIGMKLTAYYEDGQFAQYKDVYRSSVNNNYNDNYYRTASSADRFAYSLSFNTGMDVKLKNNKSMGLVYSLGSTTTLPKHLTDLNFSGILNYTTNKFTVYFQNSGSLIIGNNDFIIGFNYRLQ